MQAGSRLGLLSDFAVSCASLLRDTNDLQEPLIHPNDFISSN